MLKSWLKGWWLYRIIWLIIILAILSICKLARAEVTPPENLVLGLIAEDTSGDEQVYLDIASVVYNRLNQRLNHGLVALKRQNLRQFVKENCDYMLKTKGIDLTKLATKAVSEVFNGKPTHNATHYEHTGHYPIPKWAKNMQVVKVSNKGTKKEITFWKGGKK